MSDTDPKPAGLPPVHLPSYRCHRCDSLVPEGARQCLMCGLPRPPEEAPASEEARPPEPPVERVSATPFLKPVEPAPPLSAPAVIESPVRERRSNLVFWIVTAVVAVLMGLAWLGFRQRAPEVMAAFIPTTTPLPPTITNTPTWTPIPTETLPPSQTPTETPVPPPTSTPQPPRTHTISPGETLFGLSLIYRVSPGSIAEANGFGVEAPIQSGQTLVIPWPTATPPLESMILEINGQRLAADVTECNIVTIQSGDSAYGLAATFNVPLEAIIAVNRQTAESIQLLQPGDALCIPKLVDADTLPPTPGPSPTPSLTPPPPGPALLSPVSSTVADGSGDVLLQWAAVKNLDDNEWYMIEMREADATDMLPLRGFTRDSSFRVPSAWRPTDEAPHTMEWTVSIVHVTGRRSDGGFTYTFGGQQSRPAAFTWIGAPPTATPTNTPTATPTPAD